jgi:hypothetical protein
VLIAIVPNSALVRGTMNSCDASTMPASISAMPVNPTMPKPGITNSSTARNTMPETNSTTSSQPEVPPRKRAQKKRAKHNPAVSAPMPTPGALIS